MRPSRCDDVTNATRSSDPLEGTNRVAFARWLPPAGQESDRVSETLTVKNAVDESAVEVREAP